MRFDTRATQLALAVAWAYGGKQRPVIHAAHWVRRAYQRAMTPPQTLRFKED